MKVTRSDLSAIVNETCQQLQHLKSTIGEEVSNVNDEEIKKIVDLLQHDTNMFAKQVHQSRDFSPLDPKLKSTLRELMFSIQHMAAFSQAIGVFQEQLLGVFRKIETSIAKFESKVEKIDPMH